MLCANGWVLNLGKLRSVQGCRLVKPEIYFFDVCLRVQKLDKIFIFEDDFEIWLKLNVLHKESLENGL